MASKTPGQRIAESTFLLEDGDTWATLEAKRAELARKIDRAIERAKKPAKKKGGR